MAGVPEDEQKLIAKPLTAAVFNEMSASAHAWWKWELKSDCHPEAGLSLVIHAFNGREPSAQMRTRCRECGRLCGVIEVKR